MELESKENPWNIFYVILLSWEDKKGTYTTFNCFTVDMWLCMMLQYRVNSTGASAKIWDTYLLLLCFLSMILFSHKKSHTSHLNWYGFYCVQVLQSCSMLQSNMLNWTSFYCNTINCSTIHCSTLNYSTLNCGTLKCNTLNFITLHYSLVYWNIPLQSVLCCITCYLCSLHCSTLNCSTLHCNTCHCTALLSYTALL